VSGFRGIIGAATLLGALSGCNLMSGGVNVEPVAVATQKPGNVALYVSVSKHGNGVLGLQKNDFKVYENGFPLDNEQIKLTLLSTNPSTSRHATLLVDMSKALKLALERERDSESYYRFMAERVPNTELGRLFMELAEMEWKHKTDLQAEYDTTFADPERFLLDI